jgi:hypothetical protein
MEATCVQIEILNELDVKSIWKGGETNLWAYLDKEVVILNYNLNYPKQGYFIF